MKKVIDKSITCCFLMLVGAVQIQSAAWAGGTQETESSSSKPRLLTQTELDGLSYLIKQQNEDGSWSQGEESQFMRSVGQKNGDIHNVADTCMAATAVIRAGNLPDHGQYGANVAKAANYVCASIEKSDPDTLSVTDVRGTRVQVKLGQYVDTFLASVFLPEVKGHMGSPEGNERVATALNKVIHKIERNQRPDGTIASDGWAPVHSQSLALQGLNKAKQVGMKVDDAAMSRAESYEMKSYSKSTGFSASGSAGVPLYSAAAALGGLQSSLNTYAQEKDALQKIAHSTSASKEERAHAVAKLQDSSNAAQEQADALDSVTSKLGDKGFIQGFGCNGGEEFLSYLQISETLLANKSKAWPDWSKNISSNLIHVQNQDGSWMGQHCITSRTFCTAAALQVLLADRSEALKSIASVTKDSRSR